MIFYKLQANGNDFIVIYNTKISKKLIKRICQNHFSVGADGIISLHKINNYDLGMWIYNFDGSQAKMCGNGLKIVAYFLRNIMKIEKEEYEILVNNEVMATVGYLNEQYYALLDKPKFLKRVKNYYIYNVGNLHAIKLVDYLSKSSLTSDKKNKEFDGMNVTNVQIIDNNRARILTFENGVGITNSCGSASLCTFQYLLDLEKVGRKVEFLSLGGHYSVEKIYDKLCLFGKVNYVYKGELIDEY
ncbi:MAG: diaminopimelate epimerase [Erysipelotrichales bacterium]|nr:diaminopimelate epimerase [Erysipelotrichales bacterium]